MRLILHRGRHRGPRKAAPKEVTFELTGERDAWIRASEYAEQMLAEVAKAAEQSTCKNWDTHPVGCGCSHRKAKS
jgi:hypothetical protein